MHSVQNIRVDTFCKFPIDTFINSRDIEVDVRGKISNLTADLSLTNRNS